MVNNNLASDIKKKYLDKKGFVQISFAWLFAIIVGAVILFFAIYASVKLIGTEGTVSSTEAGKEIDILLNPLETGFNEEKTTPLSTSVETRINNGCSEPEESSLFGKQKISVSQKVSDKWTDTGIESISYNKYVFSGRSTEGEDFYLFSKPFNFPFKVADLIILTSSNDKYCFDDAPEKIKEELSALGQANLFVENCPEESQKICFNGGGDGCNVEVDTYDNSVIKIGSGEEKVYYETDALMYAAIFSDANLYECQVKRLMQRLESLVLVYNEKESVLSNIGCTAEVNMLSLADSAENFEDSSDLITVKQAADDAEDSNEDADCGLW